MAGDSDLQRNAAEKREKKLLAMAEEAFFLCRRKNLFSSFPFFLNNFPFLFN
jgi:hypothetical protein